MKFARTLSWPLPVWLKLDVVVAGAADHEQRPVVQSDAR